MNTSQTSTPLKKNMKTIKVSLSRAHKIVERLKVHNTELLASVESLSVPAHVNVRLVGGNAEAVKRYEARGSEVLEQLQQVEALARAGAYVRDVIARENVRRGISEKLSRLEAANKMVGALKNLSGLRHPADLEFSDLPSLLANAKDEEALSVRLNLLTPEHRNHLKQKLSALTREAVVLSDEVAEANAAPVELTLEDDIAALAMGLEA